MPVFTLDGFLGHRVMERPVYLTSNLRLDCRGSIISTQENGMVLGECPLNAPLPLGHLGETADAFTPALDFWGEL